MNRNTPRSLRTTCVHPGRPTPNLDDYDRVRDTFSWDLARNKFMGPAPRRLNMAIEALDRHVDAGTGDRLAMRFVARDWSRDDYSYAELARLSSRFANVLDCLGIEAGERVFFLADQTPEAYIALFGTLKACAVGCALRTTLGRGPIRSQVSSAGARVLVTTLAHYRHKISPLRKSLPRLAFVLLTDAATGDLPPDTFSYPELMSAVDDTWRTPSIDAAAPALLNFNHDPSGQATGRGCAHEDVVAHYVTGRYALDLHAGDIYWCTLDPASAIGMSYGAIAPLVNGVSVIVDQAEFDAERWYRVLQEESVNVWHTTPTAIRMLMKAGNALATSFCFSHLRHVATAGEPLAPQCVIWGEEIFCMPIHETWAQAETGIIMIANYRGTEVRPGSMGRPIPGVEAAIVKVGPPRASGEPLLEFVLKPGEPGELAVRAGWSSLLRGLANGLPPGRRMAGGWCLTGDLAWQDADGWLWFAGHAERAASRQRPPIEAGRALMKLPVRLPVAAATNGNWRQAP